MRLGPALLLLCLAARADTVVLKSGKKLHGRVVAEDPEVVLNTFNSTHPQMTLGVVRIPREKVSRIHRDLPRPHQLFHRKAREATTVEACLELARWCAGEKLREEQALAYELALALDPANEEARKALGSRAPRGDAAQRRELASKFVAEGLEETLAAIRKDPEFPWAETELRRARRSASQPKGYVEDRPLSLRADRLLPNASYTYAVPEGYDPLTPTPLVIGLHGGGAGGADGKLVVGRGRDTITFYREECAKRGWICVCPNALTAGWGSRENCDLIDALLEEILALYNVDENRIYLVGHSMGGGGAWAQGGRLLGTWAAVAPAASFGPSRIPDYFKTQTGLYVYHSDDDPRTRVEGVRPAMETYRGTENDYVYTELPGKEHSFPMEVVADIFEYFDLHRRALPPRYQPTVRPQSSFLRKVSKDERKYLAALGGGAAEPEGIDALLRDLRAGGGLAEQSVAKLVASGDPAVASRVARILTHADSGPDVRRYAARTLELLGAKEQAKPLAKALLLETESNALLAILDALIAIGDPAIFDDAARFLKSRREFLGRKVQGGNLVEHSDWEAVLPSLARGCTLLAKLGDPRGSEAIARQVVEGILLSDLEVVFDRQNQNPLPPAQALAEAACQALRSLGDPGAAPALERLAAGGDRVGVRTLQGPISAMGGWPKDPRIAGAAREARDALR